MATASASSLEAHHGGDGPERLLGHDGHPGLDAGDDGRREEAVGMAVRRRQSLAAGHDGGAARDGVGDVLLDLGDRPVIDQRADVRARS